MKRQYDPKFTQSDYRAIYEEVAVGEDTVTYFFLLGTHEQLYGKPEEDD